MARPKKFDEKETLNKAMNLFWEKGYNGTSMQDLIDKLGINRASLYDTYGSKYSIFEQALKSYKQQNLKRIADLLYYHTHVREGFYVMFELLVDQALSADVSRGCLVTNTITELVGQDQNISKIVFEDKSAFEEMYYNYLKYGVDNSQISPYKDLRAIASYIYALQNGLNVASKVQQDKGELLKIASTGLIILD